MTHSHQAFPLMERQFVDEETRRRLGAVYTPFPIVEAMMNWAKAHATPSRIVDPGAGSGRFTIAALRAFPAVEVIAVEIDPLAVSTLERNVRASGMAGRVRILNADFREVMLPSISGRTLFIGNPPYVRHHAIEPKWKNWYSQTAMQLGFRASELAGLHLHFFLKVRTLATPGDYGALITSAEWLTVNYGETLRKMLLNGLGLLSLDLFDAKSNVFPDVMTTAAVTCFEVGATREAIAFGQRGSGSVAQFGRGSLIGRRDLLDARKWPPATGSNARARGRIAKRITVGDLFRVKRGQVTGANSMWIAGENPPPLPQRFLVPTVTRAKELISSGGHLADARALRRVIDLPPDLSHLDAHEIEAVRRFLDVAASKGIARGYVASHRAAWWSVALYPAAPILCTYMARRAPVFVRNVCGARHINIAHGLYPKAPLGEKALDAITAWLNKNVEPEMGRVYAGGLLKFEPREIEAIGLPRMEDLLSDRCEVVEDRGIAEGGRQGQE